MAFLAAACTITFVEIMTTFLKCADGGSIVQSKQEHNLFSVTWPST